MVRTNTSRFQFLWYVFLIISVSFAYAEESREGYVGAHWLTNPARHEIVHLSFKGADRRMTSIGGFGDDFTLAFHPRKNYGWATNHTVFGPLVKFVPAEKDIVPIDGFKHPLALGLSLKDESLWVLEREGELMHLDSSGNVLARFNGLPQPHTLDVSPLDSSVWVGYANTLIKFSQTGEKLAQLSTDSPILSISADLRDGGCWTAMKEENFMIKFSATGKELFRVQFQNLKAISTTPAFGGCWVVDGAQVVFVTADGVKSDVVLGYEEITSISRNLSDGTFWVTDQGGERLSKIPQDENEAVLAVIGLRDRKDNNLQAARHAAIRLVRVAPDHPEKGKDGREGRMEEGEGDVTTPSAVPNATSPLVEEKPGEEVDTSKVEQDKQDEPDTPASPPLIGEGLSEADTPPESQISRIPSRPQPPEKEFPGIVFIELSSRLSQKRLKNTASVLGRRYIWNFDEETYTLLIGLDVETYNTYANTDRLSLGGMTLKEVPVTEKIAAEFNKLAGEQGWNGEKLVSFVLAFVQSLPYTVDQVTTGYDEFIAYAYETLVAGGGDCEDTTILATSILIGLGYDVVLLNPPGHLAFGIEGNYGGSYIEHEGKRYFYCESTGTGWRIGQIPDVYQGAKFRVIPILSQGNEGMK